MSFRPTICVAARGGIADMGYYRNWDVEDLFIESIALAVIYSDLKTVEAVRDRAFGRQEIKYVVEPETFDNTQETFEFFLECSEFPITVDLEFGGIYSGYPVESVEEFDRIPDFDKLDGLSRGDDFYWDLMDNYKIPFKKLDLDHIRDLFLRDDGLRSRLSIDTKSVMERTFKERIGEHDDEAGVHKPRS